MRHDTITAPKSSPQRAETVGHRPLPATLRPTFLLGAQAGLPSRPATDSGLTDILVNGTWHTVSGRTISYEQVVKAAVPQPVRPIETVTFRDGDPSWSFGELRSGERVPLAQNMRFQVILTALS